MFRLRTAFKLISGFGLLIVGVFLSLPGIPGPGLLVIGLGLWLLSDHCEWARRALAWGQERFARLRRPRSGAPADGQPRASTAAREQADI